MLPKHLLGDVRGGGQAARNRRRTGGRSAPARTASRSGRAARRSCSSPTPTTSRGARTSRASSTASSRARRRSSSSSRPRAWTWPALTASSTCGRPSTRPSGRRTKSIRYPGSGYTYFGFNLKDPRFADRRVRQAFAHAINKKELIEGVVLGLAREADGPVPAGTLGLHRRGEALSTYDPEKATALLAEAGWKDRNGDGLRRGQGRQAVHLHHPDEPGQRRAQEGRRDHPAAPRASWA